MNKRILLLTCAALMAMPAWAVNKCKGPNGQVVFQDTACPEQGVAVKVWSSGGGASSPNSDSAARVRADVEAVNRRAKVREAIAMQQPVVGMTRAELEQALGEPSAINSIDRGGSLQDEMVFVRPGQSLYVYAENGVVTGIHNGPGKVAARSAPRCPSAMDIKNMETGASSITLSANERAARKAQIEEAKRCGR